MWHTDGQTGKIRKICSMNTFVLRNIKYDSSITEIMAWCIGVLSKETKLITLSAIPTKISPVIKMILRGILYELNVIYLSGLHSNSNRATWFISSHITMLEIQCTQEDMLLPAMCYILFYTAINTLWWKIKQRPGDYSCLLLLLR